MALTISTRVLGKRTPLLDDFSVPPPPNTGGDELLLRHVIEHVVRQQVIQFNARQESLRFDRALSKAEVNAGMAKGKVDPASKESVSRADAEEAVAVALTGFTDGLFLVIIDERERKDLDEPVRLSDDSRLVFIRLTFLAGA